MKKVNFDIAMEYLLNTLKDLFYQNPKNINEAKNREYVFEHTLEEIRLNSEYWMEKAQTAGTEVFKDIDGIECQTIDNDFHRAINRLSDLYSITADNEEEKERYLDQVGKTLQDVNLAFARKHIRELALVCELQHHGLYNPPTDEEE